MEKQFETLATQIINKCQVMYRYAHSSQERKQVLINMKAELAALKESVEITASVSNKYTPSLN